jgi:hypothetical protein
VAFLNSVPDNIAEKAADIQSRHRQVVEWIRSDNSLSAQGRLKQLARARLGALAEMTKLREGFEGKEAKTAETFQSICSDRCPWWVPTQSQLGMPLTGPGRSIALGKHSKCLPSLKTTATRYWLAQSHIAPSANNASRSAVQHGAQS